MHVLFVTYVVLFQLYAVYGALNKIKRFVYIEIEAYFCPWFNNEDIPIDNIKTKKICSFWNIALAVQEHLNDNFTGNIFPGFDGQ